MIKAQGTGVAGFNQVLLKEMRRGFAEVSKQNKQLEARIDAKFEKFMGLVVDEFAKVDERFDQIDQRFESLELEMHGGFAEVHKILNRHDTRISALEYKVFP